VSLRRLCTVLESRCELCGWLLNQRVARCTQILRFISDNDKDFHAPKYYGGGPLDSVVERGARLRTACVGKCWQSLRGQRYMHFDQGRGLTRELPTVITDGLLGAMVNGPENTGKKSGIDTSKGSVQMNWARNLGLEVGLWLLLSAGVDHLVCCLLTLFTLRLAHDPV
jgi:hypothetical protein